MRILILGSLGPNQDRVLDLLDLGHQVVYLYSQPSGEFPAFANALQCIPVIPGAVADQVAMLAAQHGLEIIYSLTSSYDGSLEVLSELLAARPRIGIVRHYKEHPATRNALERDSLLKTDGQIYSTHEALTWFTDLYAVRQDTAHILDPDPISARHLEGTFAPKLRGCDGAPHIVVGGSISASNDRYDVRELCVEMNRRGVFVHLYAAFLGRDPSGYVRIEDDETRLVYIEIARRHRRVKLHDLIHRSQIVSCWSQYDAGFMHSTLGPGDSAPEFERMNIPHRYSAYLAAGLPLLSSIGGHDAMESLIRERQVGFLFQTYDELADWLWNGVAVESVADTVRRTRHSYTFAAEVPQLVSILKRYVK